MTTKRYEIEATTREVSGWHVVEPGAPEQMAWSVYARDADGYASWCRDFRFGEVDDLVGHAGDAKAQAIAYAKELGRCAKVPVFLRNEQCDWDEVQS